MSLTTSKHGIAIVANDKVYKWLLAFLESFSQTNGETPLYVIPYDENVSATRRAAEVYGAHFVEEVSEEIDILAKRLYPLAPHRRNRLRKLQALALPLDQVIYLDVDIVLFRDFTPLFGKLVPGECDFIIASMSPEYVYNKKSRDHDFLANAILFNDGFFSTAAKILSLTDFMRTMDEDEKIFHAVRKRGGLFAQPLVNFVVHRKGLKVKSLAACLPRASDESFYKPVSAAIPADGIPVDGDGREIYFSHWAGATGMPKNGIFDAIWLRHYQNGAARMERA